MKLAIFILCFVTSLVMVLASLVYENTFMFLGACLMVFTSCALVSTELNQSNN